MTELNALCVYTGSSVGSQNAYRDMAIELGRRLAERKIELVYGGGNVGLMGVIADTVLDGGGQVTGVIPDALRKREVAHLGLTRMHVVDSMHQRKTLMADLADGFVAMPGGFGTLEEIFEVLTWAQLGFHTKPCGLLNVGGYYDGLLQFLDWQVEQGFVMQAHRDLIYVDDDPARLLDRYAAHQPEVITKRFDRVDLR